MTFVLHHFYRVIDIFYLYPVLDTPNCNIKLGLRMYNCIYKIACIFKQLYNG